MRRKDRRWRRGAKRGDGDAAQDEVMAKRREAMATRRETKRL